MHDQGLLTTVDCKNSGPVSWAYLSHIKLPLHSSSGPYLTIISDSTHLCAVTDCKHGYFRWGKISRKCWQDISCGDNFHDTTPISFIKAYGFYFHVGVIFAKKTKAPIKRKLPPCENFNIYSI